MGIIVGIMLEFLNRNSGAIMVILAMLTLGSAGIGWVINEINDVRGEITDVRDEVTDVRKDLADAERRLTEKIHAQDARIAEIQQSLVQMETRIDTFLDAIANHTHTEDGVVFIKPVSEQQTASPTEAVPSTANGSSNASRAAPAKVN